MACVRNINIAQREFKQLQSQLVELKKYKYDHSDVERRLLTQIEDLKTKNVKKAQVCFGCFAQVRPIYSSLRANKGRSG